MINQPIKSHAKLLKEFEEKLKSVGITIESVQNISFADGEDREDGISKGFLVTELSIAHPL